MANDSTSIERLPVSADVMRRASSVGPKATLLAVQLVRMSAELGEAHSTILKFSRHARDWSVHRLSTTDSVSVVLRFGLDLANTEEEKNSPTVRLLADYSLVYRIDRLSEFDEEDLKAFAQLNGTFNAWPFWRELSSSTLARMQTGNFVLPSLRVEQTPTVVKV